MKEAILFLFLLNYLSFNLNAQHQLPITFSNDANKKLFLNDTCEYWHLFMLDAINNNNKSVQILTAIDNSSLNKRVEIRIENAQIHGKQYFYYPNGKIERALYYHENYPMGWQILYDSLGNILQEIRVENAQIKETVNYFLDLNFDCNNSDYPYNVTISDTINLTAKFDTTNANELNVMKLGMVRRDMGMVTYKESTVKIKTNGILKDYYYDLPKRIRTRIPIKKGLVHGVMKEYYRNGKISQKIHFKNGKFHGKYVQYHENGKIKLEEYYINGVRAKDSYYYNIDGSLDYINYLKKD